VSDDLLAARRAKLDELRAAGIDPFPHAFDDVIPIEAVQQAHGDLEDGGETEERVRLAGRLMARRGQGKMAFLDLEDRSGRIQIQSKIDVLGDEKHERLLGLDLGDLIGIDGRVFKSRRGELTIQVEDFTVLAKSLRPPPDKFHGVQDVELRFRRRELDLMANAESRRIFLTRAKAITALRRYFDDNAFVEVETPVLVPLYGGALARPFVTHHNQLDRDLYLRIATELYLKRLIVGGLERVYEIGKNFRNEGVSHKHNPEFTMVEWYEAYADYHDEADRLEELVASIADAVGYEHDPTDPESIDFSPPWRRITLRDAILEEAGVDIREHADSAALAAAIGDKLPTTEGRTWPQLVDDLLSKFVEPKLIQPTFLMDYPKELSPFAKDHRSEDGVVERWEAFAGGMEIANAFTELNDPDEQRRRFETQQRLSLEGDDEAQPYDETFVEALEQGMPPTGGVGLGVDRLVMLLAGVRTLREVILFPAMRD
jgi:lysyl-tRNA synthetase class 2